MIDELIEKNQTPQSPPTSKPLVKNIFTGSKREINYLTNSDVQSPSNTIFQDEQKKMSLKSEKIEDNRQQNDSEYDQGMDYYPDLFPGMPRPIAEELLYEWIAPSRPFKKRDKQFFTTVGMVSMLISLILFFSNQLLAILVVVSLAFLVYVFTMIPPQDVVNQITTYGIRLENELYYWDELGWFWFKKKYDDELLNIEVGRFPNRLSFVIGNGDKDLIRLILSEVLLEKEPAPTYFEKASQWLQEKIPIDVN